MPIDESYRFDEGLLISTTDLQGIITYANRKFCEVSGYHKNELKNKNHHIVRHPDMPKELFQKLWETIHSKREWAGLIKNLRKDGRYYWVYTHITPLFFNNRVYGYTAINRPASSHEIEEASLKYAQMLQQENIQKAI